MYYLDILSYLAEKTSPGMLFDKNFTVFSLFKLYLELYYSKIFLQTLMMLFCLIRIYTINFIVFMFQYYEKAYKEEILEPFLIFNPAFDL